MGLGLGLWLWLEDRINRVREPWCLHVGRAYGVSTAVRVVFGWCYYGH